MGIYLAIFISYWLYNLVHMMLDLRGAANIRHFTTHKLGLSERQLQSVTWPDIAHRIVLVSSLLYPLPAAVQQLYVRAVEEPCQNSTGAESLQGLFMYAHAL